MITRRRRRTGLWAALILVLTAVAYVLLAVDRTPLPPAAGPGTSNSSLLALTWAPSLCTVDRANAGCRSGHVGRLGPVFLLHGLWPQPDSEQYCAVPQKSHGAKAPVVLPDELRTALRTKMSDASIMTRHEWYAHGTCSGVTPPEYFGIAANLTDQANAVLDPLFAGARGRDISARAVRDTFDTRFGPGAGRRITLNCRNGGNGRALVYEVRLSLPAVPELRTVSLQDALTAGPAVPAGCGKGGVP